MKIGLINVLKKIKHKLLFDREYKKFLNTGLHSKQGYSSFRQLFIYTKGKSNDLLSLKINKKIGKYKNINSCGILGHFTQNELLSMAAEMRRDGFFLFNKVLPEKMTDAILDYAVKTPISFMDVNSNIQVYSKEKVLFNELCPLSPRYELNSQEIYNCEEFQKLIYDQSLLAFAQEYLGCKPILDLVACWWSAPFEGKGKSAAAQMYHFDLDRIKFMKFFFYITDVDTNTGPHCYVKGSHGILPKEILRDGRYEDEELKRVYGAENMLELCGKRGSIIAVDTRGFHKGKDLLKDKRLLFQIQFTNSLFGQSYNPIDGSLINLNYFDIIKKFNYSYKNIFAANH